MIALQNIEELQKQKQEEEQVYPMITHYAFILSSGRIIIITLDLPCNFMWGNGFRNSNSKMVEILGIGFAFVFNCKNIDNL